MISWDCCKEQMTPYTLPDSNQSIIGLSPPSLSEHHNASKKKNGYAHTNPYPTSAFYLESLPNDVALICECSICCGWGVLLFLLIFCHPFLAYHQLARKTTISQGTAEEWYEFDFRILL